MPQIPNIDPNLLLRAFSSPGAGQAIQSGVAGFEKGADLATKLQEQRAKRRTQEMELMKELAALQKSQQEQASREDLAKGMAPIDPLKPAARIGEREVPLSQVASVEPETGRVLQTGQEIGEQIQAPQRAEQAAWRLFPEKMMDHQSRMQQEIIKQQQPTIDREKAPTGYRWTGEGDLETIPGGPAWQKQQEAQEKEILRKEEAQRAGTTVVQDLQWGLDEHLPNISQGAGVLGGMQRAAKGMVKGTPERMLKLRIDSALSNVGLDRLTQMRRSSPTGGALGQVPIQQQLRLEKVLGSMELDHPPAELEANMKRVMNIYFDVMYGSSEERARAVKAGKMTQDESDHYESLYYDLPFKEFKYAPDKVIQKRKREAIQNRDKIEREMNVQRALQDLQTEREEIMRLLQAGGQ